MIPVERIPIEAFQPEMVQPDLHDLCAEWQRELRLQDWDVVAQYRRGHAMRDPDNQGECAWLPHKKLATIYILDPADYPPDASRPQDVELTLVHELLHLHFAPFVAERDSAEDIAQEVAIDQIARALVALKRRSDAT